jgi:hypothetical protein
MKIKRNLSILEWMTNEIQNNLGTETREGIHLSDLLVPRKKFWQIQKPMKATLKEISYWTSGNAVEDKLLKAIGYNKGETKQWEGIFYTADTFLGNIPCEVKSRRRWLAEEGEEERVYEHYLKQLKGYCAIENSTKGWLIVLSLMEKTDETGKTEPKWMPYDVDFTPEELEEERGRLIQTKEALGNALRVLNHKDLPPCPDWMCGKVLEIIEKKSYCTECKKEFERKDAKEKHLNSKSGKGHNVSEPVIRIEYEKECKYFDLCDPFDK